MAASYHSPFSPNRDLSHTACIVRRCGMQSDNVREQQLNATYAGSLCALVVPNIFKRIPVVACAEYALAHAQRRQMAVRSIDEVCAFTQAEQAEARAHTHTQARWSSEQTQSRQMGIRRTYVGR